MNADGSGLTRLTNDPDRDAGPIWSPDSSRIAFTSERDGNVELYVMSADGSGLARLTNDPGFDVPAAWSPDGSRIAFVSDRDGNLEIYVMNADGSSQTRLTNSPGSDRFPSWQRRIGPEPTATPAPAATPTPTSEPPTGPTVTVVAIGLPGTGTANVGRRGGSASAWLIATLAGVATVALGGGIWHARRRRAR